jgi:hypothetical protein
VQQKRFSTNEEIPEDGIYYVFHPRHRLIRSVMLRQGDRFPRCSQCSDEVTFELITPGVPAEDYEPLHVYELPLRAEDEPEQPL